MPRVTSKGQVTIPQAIRERFGLHPEAEVEFEVAGNAVRLKRVNGPNGRGRALVARLKGRATSRLTTDQIMALTRG